MRIVEIYGKDAREATPVLDKAERVAYLEAAERRNTPRTTEVAMRILAVEDEPEYLEMLQEVMKSLGHSITIAQNGKEALALIDRQPIDVVVSDVKMPEMNGIEFHRKFRERQAYKNTPFIFLTGVDDVTQVKAECKGDCDLLLQKPFPIDKLLQLFAGKIK
jgi:two-component system chemotaxis response regulator CheY